MQISTGDERRSPPPLGRPQVEKNSVSTLGSHVRGAVVECDPPAVIQLSICRSRAWRPIVEFADYELRQ